MARAKTTPNGAGRIKTHSPKRLSLACGQRKPDGYFGIDVVDTEAVDLVYDLFDFPWPIKTSVVEELHAAHFVEHIPHYRPGFTKDGWWLFFDEVYRICKKNAVCTFVHPYVMSTRAFWDPTHERFIHENTWYYLNKDWRAMQGLDHYPTDVNFEVVTIEGNGVDPDIQARHHEAQNFARTRYWNVLADLSVLLRVIK